MKYIVIELQKAASGGVANIVTAHDTRNDAESKFYSIMAAAAVSTVPKHSAAIIDEDGCVVMNGCYEHEEE